MPTDKLLTACEDAVEEVSKHIRATATKLNEGTKDPEHFLSISEIEDLWSRLRQNTTKTYSDMMAAHLSDLNEQEVILSKKESTPNEESG